MRIASLRTALPLVFLIAAAPALAESQCAHSQPRSLQLDLDGVRTIVFDIGANEIDVRALPGASGEVNGRACASQAEALDRLTLTQRKSGDTLHISAERAEWEGMWFGNRYAYLQLAAEIPDHIDVHLDVGSGDARLSGARSARIEVGSGDVEVSRIATRLAVSVASGDLEIDEVGELQLTALNSGDVTVRRVRGAAEIGRVGSGDLSLREVGGGVRIEAIGSGDVELAAVGGDVTVGSVGSGDLQVRDVRGGLSVRSVGSGDVRHDGVAGRVDTPRQD